MDPERFARLKEIRQGWPSLDRSSMGVSLIEKDHTSEAQAFLHRGLAEMARSAGPGSGRRRWQAWSF
jgi:hypothetical protein